MNEQIPKRPKGGMTAAELMALLEADPEWVRARDQREAELQARVALLSAAEQPIVADIRAAGYGIESVWDLVNTSVPYPDALPVLLRHLQKGGYPDRVMESMARAIAVGPAVKWWDELRDLYLRARGRGEEQGLAVALAACATSQQLDEMIALVRNESLGPYRCIFFEKIKRFGGDRGVEILESFRGDALLGKEATHLLKTKRVRRSS
ncbi:MAG: hypothetical protein WBD02_11285 [Acidimicrobiia bacterium]